MKCVIGVDLGGTNVRAGAFFEDGSEAGQSFQNPSYGQSGVEKVIDAIASTVAQAVEASSQKPEAVGLAIPGHIDDVEGVVRWAPNFGETLEGVFNFWTNVPVRELLEPKLGGLKVHMDNDANMAALGEYRFGSGKNSAKCLVMLTLGTGIGGGVIMSPDAVLGDARGPLILVGGNKGGAELGHTIVQYQGVDCRAGEYGSIEGYCGRDAIITRAQHRLVRGRESILREMLGKDYSKLTPLMLSQAAAKGDELSIEVWEEVGTMLGVGIANFINIFAPDIVAIGGNVARAGDLLLKPAIKTARNIAIKSLFDDARILVAEQIDDAGMLGGAALALEALKWERK
ncbi:MAG TPA: ROK family protein [Fimbriimonas sp.]|nr:ROK family protein [Fimbriimonas sp.]